MYDLRCTMYDLDYSAPEARDAEREQGDVMEPCVGVDTKGRGRLTPPMYDVGCTMYDLDYSAPEARDAERERRWWVELYTDVVTKGRGRLTPPMYDVGCTMYDLDYSAPEARAMRSFSEGGGRNHGWLLVRKVSNFAEPCPRRCYIVHY